MYPLIRLGHQLWIHRNTPPLGFFDTHVSHHRCYPWDLDVYFELNNGRTLTFFDLGRIPLAKRIGMFPVLRQNKWSLTLAGGSVRYRKRVRAWQKVTIKSRGVGWDEKFIYLEHAMFDQAGTCTSHFLVRSALTDKNGLVPPERLAEALGAGTSPPLPEWIKAWTEADATRPWPPFTQD